MTGPIPTATDIITQREMSAAEANVLRRIQAAADRATILQLQTALDIAARTIGKQAGEISDLRDEAALLHERISVLETRLELEMDK